MANVNKTLHPQGDASTNVYPYTKFANLLDIPSITNNKYLHTNALTGALEWADAQGGGLTIPTITIASSQMLEVILNHFYWLQFTSEQLTAIGTSPIVNFTISSLDANIFAVKTRDVDSEQVSYSCCYLTNIPSHNTPIDYGYGYYIEIDMTTGEGSLGITNASLGNVLDTSTNPNALAINMNNGATANAVSGAIQIGTGTNSYSGTLQVWDYTLMGANGKIPLERIDVGYTITAYASSQATITYLGHGAYNNDKLAWHIKTFDNDTTINNVILAYFSGASTGTITGSLAKFTNISDSSYAENVPYIVMGDGSVTIG